MTASKRIATGFHYFDSFGGGVEAAVIAVGTGDGDELGARLRLDDLDHQKRQGSRIAARRVRTWDLETFIMSYRGG